MMHGFGFGSFGSFGMYGLVGLLVMFLFWGGLILLAIWLVKTIFQTNRQPLTPPTERDFSTKEILDQRYARGEITREQYELIKQDLSG